MVVQKLDFRTVSLVPDTIVMESEKVLTQYFITTWSLVYRNESNATFHLCSLLKSTCLGDHQRGVKMEVVFKRRLTNELLTTYLPSVLLILISYATTFFKPFFFEAALTVNLTTMLVMTTLFISVMEKLPSTAYVKMIDLWLIFGQLIPFMEVCLLTMMESSRDGDGDTQTINHHGHPRTVQLNNGEKVKPMLHLFIYKLQYHFQNPISLISVEAFANEVENVSKGPKSKAHLVPIFELIGTVLFL